MQTLTRAQPAGWAGYSRRVDGQMLREVAWPAADSPLAFVCGPTSFVEAVADGLVTLGYQPQRVKPSDSARQEVDDGSARRQRNRWAPPGDLRPDMTMATGICAHCGSERVLAECRVYMRAPGVVVRCRTCDIVLAVFVERNGLHCVDIQGLRALHGDLS